jgi:hypothetical protein
MSAGKTEPKMHYNKNTTHPKTLQSSNRQHLTTPPLGNMYVWCGASGQGTNYRPPRKDPTVHKILVDRART